MKRGILTIVIALLAINLTFACNCGELTTKEAYKSSDLIFTGKLIDKQIIDSEIDAPNIKTKQRYTTIVFTFEVKHLLKGKQKSKIIQITSKYNGINFEMGQNYLLYAYLSEYLLTSNFYLNGEKVPAFLATDVCTKTKKMAQVDKKVLKKLKKLARRYYS